MYHLKKFRQIEHRAQSPHFTSSHDSTLLFYLCQGILQSGWRFEN